MIATAAVKQDTIEGYVMLYREVSHTSFHFDAISQLVSHLNWQHLVEEGISLLFFGLQGRSSPLQFRRRQVQLLAAFRKYKYASEESVL